MILRSPRHVSLLALVVLCSGVGALSASRFAPDPNLVSLARSVPRCRLEGTVIESSGLGSFVQIQSAVCGDAITSEGVVVLDDEDVDLGAVVEGTGTLIPLDASTFDRARERFGASARLVGDLTVSPPVSPLWRVTWGLRRGFARATEAAPPAAGALLRGLTIGDVSDLPAADLESLRRAGLTHLVAVSGENVAIVLAAVATVIRGLAARLRVLLCGAALGAFVAVVGPDASVLRAAVMGALGLLALAIGRRTNPVNLVALATLILFAMRPPLVYSVGFLLSVAATLGIVLWAPGIARLSRLPGPVALPVAVTAAAQAAVAPILIVTFGELSLVGLVANVIAAPAVAPATVLGLLSALLAQIAPSAARVVAVGAAPFSEWILGVARVAGSLPWAMVPVPWPVGAGLAVFVVVGMIRSALAATGDTVSV
ncbi:MAG TPA: ComEC/Rec2 family competence protein [Actinomycetota bacterium]|nr:ComEC/Rec2 family competence protein [Actinomycetota bacterium]